MPDKIKDYIMKNKRKLTEKAIIAGIIGVVIMIAGSVLFPGDNKDPAALYETESSTASGGKSGSEIEEMYAGMEKIRQDMTDILGSIENAGKVKVMLSYTSSSEKVLPKNTSSSSSQKLHENGDNEISGSKEEEIQGGGEVVVKEVLPEIEGIVIIAQGAGRGEVKAALIAAAKVLTDLPDYKIEVLQGN